MNEDPGKRTVAQLRTDALSLQQSLGQLQAKVAAADAHPGPNAARLAMEWTEQLDNIARQVGKLGREVTPLLEHLVLRPVDFRTQPSLEVLLNTLLLPEQNREDAEILATAPDITTRDVSRINFALQHALNEFAKLESGMRVAYGNARERMHTTMMSSEPVTALNPRWESLIQLWRRGDPSGTVVVSPARAEPPSSQVDDELRDFLEDVF